MYVAACSVIKFDSASPREAEKPDPERSPDENKSARETGGFGRRDD
jgi:hypothetical protein